MVHNVDINRAERLPQKIVFTQPLLHLVMVQLLGTRKEKKTWTIRKFVGNGQCFVDFTEIWNKISTLPFRAFSLSYFFSVFFLFDVIPSVRK